MYITQEQKQKFKFHTKRSCNNNCGCTRSMFVGADYGGHNTDTFVIMHESYWKSGLCPQCYMEQNKDSKLLTIQHILGSIYNAIVILFSILLNSWQNSFDFSSSNSGKTFYGRMNI